MHGTCIKRLGLGCLRQMGSAMRSSLAAEVGTRGVLLQIFGSFATGLHLPTSDVDCVITDSNVAPRDAGNALTALGTALRGKEWVKDLEVRSAAHRCMCPLLPIAGFQAHERVQPSGSRRDREYPIVPRTIFRVSIRDN